MLPWSLKLILIFHQGLTLWAPIKSSIYSIGVELSISDSYTLIGFAGTFTRTAGFRIAHESTVLKIALIIELVPRGITTVNPLTLH